MQLFNFFRKTPKKSLQNLGTVKTTELHTIFGGKQDLTFCESCGSAIELTGSNIENTACNCKHGNNKQ